MKKFEFPFLLLHLLLLLSKSQVSSFKCQESERKALLKFKQNIIDKSNRLASWEANQDCCKWKGVNCHNSTGSSGAITSLDLRCNTANSCTQLQAFKLDSSLLELKHLEHLDLSGNNFNGIQIPPFIGSMNQLQYLNLSLAMFGGKVPHQLGNLTNLRVLDLFNSGDFPMKADKLEWTFGLHNLQFLELSAIDLSQAFDSIQVLHKLPSLLHLRLSNCLLNNTHFTQNSISRPNTSILQFLDMSNNLFDGPTPTKLANLSSIRFLDLSFNYLSSSIPSWLQTQRNLQILNLAGNNLDGVEGGILSLLGRLCGLKSLDLSLNDITNGILDSKVNFSICSEYNLESMYLNVNNITGELSIWVEKFKHLRYLDLGSNSFSGHISMSFDVLSSLQHIDLSNNRFSGNIPTSIGSVSSLEWLDLSNNHFNGVVSEVNFANLSRLTYLDLSSNSFQTLIEASVDVRTTDGYVLRLFAIAFTKKQQNQAARSTCYAQSGQVRNIRKKMFEIMTEEASKCDLKELVQKFIAHPDSIGAEIEKKCQSIFPLQNVLIRKVKMLKKPKFDVTKLMELHGDTTAEDSGVAIDKAAAANTVKALKGSGGRL